MVSGEESPALWDEPGEEKAHGFGGKILSGRNPVWL